MRGLGAATGLGTLGSLAGYTAAMPGDEHDDDATGGADGEVPEYQLVELIEPPTELDYENRWPEREIVMATHDASTAFFDPTEAGMMDAAEQIGWDATFTGPTHGHDPEDQVSILESTVDARPDVIATTITDDRMYDSVVQEALEEDIFVILYNTNALSREEMRDRWDRALAYVGQDQVGAGYVCGLALLDRLPDDAELVTIGTCCPGHDALEERAEGIELAVRHNSDIELTDTLNYTGDAGQGVSRLQDHIAANPDIDGIVGTDAFTWFIGEALANEGLEEDVVGGGFDLVEPTMEHIRDGVLQFTIGQDPYSQGYLPTMLAWEYLERGMPPKDYDTAAEVIDEDNIEFALRRSDWTTLIEWQRDAY